MTGIKANVKQELRDLGIKTISVNKQSIKLQNAKTSDLIAALNKVKPIKLHKTRKHHKKED